MAGTPAAGTTASEPQPCKSAQNAGCNSAAAVHAKPTLPDSGHEHQQRIALGTQARTRRATSQPSARAWRAPTGSPLPTPTPNERLISSEPVALPASRVVANAVCCRSQSVAAERRGDLPSGPAALAASSAAAMAAATCRDRPGLQC